MRTPLKEAFQLRKDHQFREAIALYDPLWKEVPEQFNDWAGWSYAFSLSKLRRYDQALNICRETYKRHPKSEVLNGLYARCIYYTQFKKKPLPELEVLKRATRGMLRLSPPHTPYSITSSAIFKLVKQLMGQQQIDWREIEDWLLKMDPDLLEDQTFEIKDFKGKKREMAGKKEQWYSQMIRAKAGQKKAQEVLDTLSAARKQGIKWHYNNTIWFARKEAFALRELGEREKAEKILRWIVRRKKEWFLLFDLAQVVPLKKEALELLCRGALAKGKNKMKLKLYQAICDQLEKTAGLEELAGLHRCLIVALREENGWDVEREMLGEIEQMGLDVAKQGASSKILKKLTPFWEKHSGKIERSDRASERKQGTIVHVLPNGKAGFIKSGSDGQSYFFSVQDLKGESKIGQKVSFEWIDSFDKKKNKPSKRAIKIRDVGGG